jgi:prepilin-type N-terminal cleavage/methylation domain-containing protein
MLRTPKRSGFTLIELLVVISLLAVLTALATGTFFRIRASQQKSATEATLVKLNVALDNRWKAIGEQVKEDVRKNHVGYAACLTAAGGNPDTAQALWMYCRAKNQLPMSFREARQPVLLNGTPVLPANTVFVNAFPNPQPNNVAEARNESAACFYMAMTKGGGGGVTLDLDGLNQQVGKVTVDNVEYDCFKDSWNTPIVFVRQCYSPELNAAPYIRASTGSYDPFDPAKKGATVISGRWADITRYLSNPTMQMSGLTANYTPANNFVPTLLSAGPNKTFDGTPFGGDDIVSFRLRREGARGD